MDAIPTLFTIIFVALLISVALTFGFTLLMIILASAALATVLTLIADAVRRWRFINSAPVPKDKKPSTIEGEYQDITDTTEDI